MLGWDFCSLFHKLDQMRIRIVHNRGEINPLERCWKDVCESRYSTPRAAQDQLMNYEVIQIISMKNTTQFWLINRPH